MNEKLLEETFKRLDVLAAKLGVTVQYLWAVLLKQARVEVITSISIGGLGLLLLIAALITMWRIQKTAKDKYDGDWTDAGIGWFIASITGGLVGLTVMIMAVSHIITPALNPEYWALQQVLTVLR